MKEFIVYECTNPGCGWIQKERKAIKKRKQSNYWYNCPKCKHGIRKRIEKVK